MLRDLKRYEEAERQSAQMAAIVESLGLTEAVAAMRIMFDDEFESPLELMVAP